VREQPCAAPGGLKTPWGAAGLRAHGGPSYARIPFRPRAAGREGDEFGRPVPVYPSKDECEGASPAPGEKPPGGETPPPAPRLMGASVMVRICDDCAGAGGAA